MPYIDDRKVTVNLQTKTELKMAPSTNVTVDPTGLSKEVLITLSPVIASVAIIAVIGLLGNPVVIIFYGWKQKRTPSQMFIVALAVFDLICCCFSIPLEMVDMIDVFTFPSSGACKLLRFIIYFATQTSGLLLLAIAVDRYRKICCPLNKQISTGFAKVIIACVIILGLLFAWPSLIFYTVVEVNVAFLGFQTGISGRDCTSSSKTEYRIYVAVYHIILLLLFILSAISITVIYILVAKKILKSKNFRKNFQNGTQNLKSHLSGNNLKINKGEHAVNIQSNNVQKNCDNQTHSIDDEDRLRKVTSIAMYQSHRSEGSLIIEQRSQHQHASASKSSTGISGSVNSTSRQSIQISVVNTGVLLKTDFYKIRSDLRRNIECRTQQSEIIQAGALKKTMQMSKFTLLAICITVTYILNFLPCCTLTIWAQFSEQYELNAVSKSEFAAFQFGIRSWLVNAGINPFIYGFFNTKYRQFIAGILSRICCCRKRSRY